MSKHHDPYEDAFKAAIEEMLNNGLSEDEIGDVIIGSFVETLCEDKYRGQVLDYYKDEIPDNGCTQDELHKILTENIKRDAEIFKKDSQ